MTIYKLGDRSPKIGELQSRLINAGFAIPNLIPTLYTPEMVDVVKDFQDKHVNAKGKWLDVDGDIGEETIWALYHNSGEAQKTHLINAMVGPNKVPSNMIPQGLTTRREVAIRFAIQDHIIGVHEIPDGGNRGGGINKYGHPGWQWCLGAALYWIRQAGIYVPDIWGCRKFWNWANERGLAYPVNSPDVLARIPANIAIIIHGSTGHAMLAIGFSKDLTQFNTIAGNEGNGVRLRLRSNNTPNLKGFVNLFPSDEQPINFERKIINKALQSEPKTT